MKNALLLFLTLACTIQICSSQAYRPFLVDGAHWSIGEYFCDGNCDPAYPDTTACYISNQYSFKLVRDSTLPPDEMYLVENVLTTGHNLNFHTCSTYYNQQGSYFSPCHETVLLREDTAARKIYCSGGWGGWNTNDTTFLDFSKNAGDTMTFVCRDWYGTVLNSYWVVDSIYYTNWGSNNIKTWALHPFNGYVAEMLLYESIGANVGFWGYQPSLEGIYSTSLNGYCIGTDTDCGFSCISPLTGTQEIENTISVSLYPNPSKDVLTLNIKDITNSNELQFTLTDLFGQPLHSEPITKAQTEINISTLSSGIYLWHFTSAGNIMQSGKIVHE